MTMYVLDGTTGEVVYEFNVNDSASVIGAARKILTHYTASKYLMIGPSGMTSSAAGMAKAILLDYHAI